MAIRADRRPLPSRPSRRTRAVHRTQHVRDHTPPLAWTDARSDYVLKGFEAPVRLYADTIPSIQG